MKKSISVILSLVLVLLISFAVAEVDLSGMTFSDLLDLQQKVNQALFKSEEWKEVEVPMGAWDIGKDIPAGRYELSAPDKVSKYNYPHVTYYLERHDNGTPNKIRGQYFLKEGETLVIELFDGNVIGIDDMSVIFKPYVASFSFE